MHETSKAVARRLHDSNFITRYFKGYGIDIGSGSDPLSQHADLFPLMDRCISFDKENGNAETMEDFKSPQFDFVHSSHCLEDLPNPHIALQNWFRILKPDGHLIVLVPDEDMYEQGVFPSTFNPDHKWTFTICKPKSWSLYSKNITALLRSLGDAADIIKIEKLTATYRFGLPRRDQTRTPIGEAAIEFIVRKRPQEEIQKVEYAETKPKKKIALHRPGAIGDVIMTLSLVPLLKQKYPEHEIHYFCHPTLGNDLKGLMAASGLKRGFGTNLLEEKRNDYDQVINLVGYPLHEGYPEKPMADHLIRYFAKEMGLEITDGFPHLTIDAPQRPVEGEYATIHPHAGWSHYKNWSDANWQAVIAARPDIKFYQIGGKGDAEIPGADYSFLGWPLEKSIALLAHTKLHLGIDSWTNHATNIEWKGRGFTPAIILWGSTQCTAAGYWRNVNLSLGLPCQPCFREDPKISRMPRGPCINPPGQDYDHPHHACMAGITVERVLAEIEKIWPSPNSSEFRKFLRLLQPHEAVGFKKIRVGSQSDGGYIMLDDFNNVDAVLSLGIGDEISWDTEMASRGMTIEQYDKKPSIVPIGDFIFHHTSVVGSLNREGVTFASIVAAKRDVIAKIDIEGDEWDILENTDSATLSRVRQFVIEFHGLNHFQNETWRKRAFSALNNLMQTHVCIHVHGNNWEPFVSFDGIQFPDVFEATFVRRADHVIVPSKETFPTEIDRPNNPNAPEMKICALWPL